MELAPEFIQKYKRLLGEESVSFLEAMGGEAVSAYRVNTLKGSQKLLPEILQEDKVPWCDNGYYGKISGQSPAFQSGTVYSQESSAMLVGAVAAVQPGEKVLDLCAAPGGKSTHLASQMNQEGILISNEIDSKRAQILSENIERAGVRNAVVTNQSPAELADLFPSYFDCIVVDAPCSGEGMMRKDEKAVAQWSQDLVDYCAERQWEIVQEAYKMLAPGGRLIYSTCTFAPEENEQLIARLLEHYPDMHIQKIDKIAGLSSGCPQWGNNYPELSDTVRAWPNRVRGEGHFVATLQKTDEASDRKIREQKLSQLSTEQEKYLAEFIEDSLSMDLPKRYWIRGEHLYLLPPDCPDLRHLKVLRVGLHIGQWKKKRFEPSHSLALALPLDAFQRTYALTKDEYAKYMAGETFRVEQKDGWCVVHFSGMALGWVKIVKGVAKNFFPKGLRFHIALR